MIDQDSSKSAVVIRDFLLGRLQGAGQTEIEERLFEDEQFEARVKLEEIALADDYARGYLSASDSERFRTRFLVSTERHRAVEVSKALRVRFATVSPARVTSTQKNKGWLGFNQAVWRYAFAALLLMLVLATVWRGVKEPTLVDRIIPKRAQPKPKPSVSQPVEASHPQVESPPAHVETSPPAPPHEVVSHALTLDQSSSAQNPALLAADVAAKTGRFDIVLPSNQAGSFQVEVSTVNGESIFKADSLAANGSYLSFDMPGGLLKSGDYRVKVTQAGKEVMTAYLRVQ